MNAEQFAKIADAFLNPPDGIEPSFRQVAKLLGHSARTVKAAYFNGYGSMQPVAEMLEDRRRRAVLKRLQERERIEHALRGVHANLLSRIGTALASTPVHLEPIRDTKSARTAVMALRELADLSHELHGGERESAPSVSVNVNIGPYQAASVDPIAAREAAQSIMLRHAELFARVTGTPEEAEVVAALLAGQARRQAAQNDEEEDEDV